MRLQSVRFPFDPSVREKLSDDDLAKGVKLKFMAEIDFKCFSKVVKWSFFAQQTLNNRAKSFLKLHVKLFVPHTGRRGNRYIYQFFD